MLNHLWLAMLLTAALVAGVSGTVRPAVDGAIKASETAVTLAFGLVGVMSLWLGIMRLAERSGLVTALALRLRPLMRWLFPDVPADHPAMASMMMNIAANMLGLTNAATPLGLRAMRDLERLNRNPGLATDAMCTFLAINTGSVQLIPASAIALLASAGSVHPTAIVGTTLLATSVSSVVGLTVVKALGRWARFRLPSGRPEVGVQAQAGHREASVTPAAAADTDAAPVLISVVAPVTPTGWAVLLLVLLAFGAATLFQAFPELTGRVADGEILGQAGWVRLLNAVSLLAIPFLLTVFPLYAALRGLPVYEEFVEGAREGFQVAVRIIPFLVAMLVAIGFLRGAGAIEGFTNLLRPPLEAIGFPAELLPLSLIRPLSGSASLAAFSDVAKTFGPDSLLARTAGTLFGSTETTFYVIAVYFGSVGIRRVRHAVWAGLAADAAGVAAAVVACRMMFG